MNNTTEELLLALGVRSLAVIRWHDRLPKNLAPAEQKQWKCANPFIDVVKEIVEELGRVSDCIKAYQLDKCSPAVPAASAAPQDEHRPSLPAS
ncbi:MAG: hypothetical protein JWP47_1823 [Polaromonas sp.]|nr:hypothetical protein [Polaromonas sp.]